MSVLPNPLHRTSFPTGPALAVFSCAEARKHHESNHPEKLHFLHPGSQKDIVQKVTAPGMALTLQHAPRN